MRERPCIGLLTEHVAKVEPYDLRRMQRSRRRNLVPNSVHQLPTVVDVRSSPASFFLAKETLLRYQRIPGVVVKGAQVASGQAKDNPFPAGTIALQTPHFRELGFDISGYYPGTINVEIAPKLFAIRNPSHTFRNVKWVEGFSAEDFSFSAVRLLVDGCSHDGFIYYPHPETKLCFAKEPTVLEVIAPLIQGLRYGDRVTLAVDPTEVMIMDK